MKRRDLFKALVLTAVAPVAIGKILAKPRPFKGFGEWQEPLIGQWGGIRWEMDDPSNPKTTSCLVLYKDFTIKSTRSTVGLISYEIKPEDAQCISIWKDPYL